MAVSAAAVRTRQRTRRFYVGMAIAIALTVFAGFSRTYFLKAYFGAPELTLLLHVHGLVFTFFGLADLFILAVLVYDLTTRRRIHPATIWGGLLIVASQPLRLMIAGTPAWMSFAAWLTGL